MRVYIGRSVRAWFWTPDPSGQRLYGLVQGSGNDSEGKLVILDAGSGAVLGTIGLSLRDVTNLAVTDDGRYVYSAGVRTGEDPVYEIVRYDTETGEIDLRWVPRDPDGTPVVDSALVFMVPGRPRSVAIRFGSGKICLYDDEVARSGAAEVEYASIALLTASRIYLNSSRAGCWNWLDYDDSGVTASHQDCQSALPTDAVAESGFLYVTNGWRQYVVAGPALATYTNTGIQNPVLVIQPDRRRGYGLYGGSTLMEFDFDSGQQPQLLLPTSSSYGRSIVALPDRLLMTDGSWVVPLL